MPPLFPPEYPARPDAPLLSFGPSFSEEISRSVIGAVWCGDDARPHEADIRVAASLTMFEGFHPRDHLDCLLAAQAVAMHAAIMDTMKRAMNPDTPLPMVIKLHTSATQMTRAFSGLLRDMERRQSKPLPERPTGPSDPPGDGPSGPAPGGPAGGSSRGPARKPRKPEAPNPGQTAQAAPPPLDETAEPELPEDLVTRPDGTPGSFAAYAPLPPPEQIVIPKVAPIMLALATRPRPWRQVNLPAGLAAVASAEPPETRPRRAATRGPLDMRERLFTGDALARFAATRFDPDAPAAVPGDAPGFAPGFAADEASFELEMISTGGDPEAEAEREAMIAAHPEGKPIVTIRFGGRKPPEDPPPDG